MDINKFCSPDDFREWMRAPFNVDGKTCATNGHILLMVPQYGDFDDASASMARNIRSIVERMDGVEFMPMPAVEVPDKEECFTCNGSGKAITETCPECDGEGEVDARTDYNTYPGLECKSCGGDGYRLTVGGDKDCPDCGGSGRCYPEYVPIPIAGMYVNLVYVSLLLEEEGVEIATDTDRNMLLFRCGEQTGAIMGLRE